jgi:hypothetical protein
MIMILGPACKFIGIEIHYNDTGISIAQIAYITMILRRFGMEYIKNDLTTIDPNANLDLAEDRGEMELEDV